MFCASGKAKIKRVRGAAFEPNHAWTVSNRKFSINTWGCMIGKDFTFHIFHVDKHFNASLYKYHLDKVWFLLFERKYKNMKFIFQFKSINPSSSPCTQLWHLGFQTITTFEP